MNTMRSAGRRQPLTRWLALLLLLLQQQDAGATNYYINSVLGNDANKATHQRSPWKTTAPLKQVQLKPGDSVLFATGQSFTGMLYLENVVAREKRPVVIGSYFFGGSKRRPVLDAGDSLYTILVRHSSYLKITGLEITARVPYGGVHPAGTNLMRCGILVELTRNEQHRNIELDNLLIHDVYFHPLGFRRSAEEIRTANGTQSYGWGVRFINNSTGGKLTHIKVTNTEIYNVSHTGLKFTAPAGGLQHVVVAHCRVRHTGGPGMQLSGVTGGHLHHNRIDHSGSVQDSRNWGRGSGLWTWSCSNILIEHNRFEHANGPGDSAGVHIDFNCSDVIVQYNFSANNAGGFCEILGNNYNCAYRYNISVNDGFRIKGQNGAFQEGKVFWLSGYQGEKKTPHGPFNSYFYNNTVFVDTTITPKISISSSARGILIANNLFYFGRDAIIVTGDQKKNEAASQYAADVVFTNNFFLRRSAWPEQLFVDSLPSIGPLKFVKSGGLDPEHYIPVDGSLIKDKGIMIRKIPGDSKGLFPGLHVARDFLGNPVSGLPDIGAIELYSKPKRR
ncbi:right-handed parallel beta-helix repeat-containing protein [Flaviaesturariibacter amylovorans]|uniref:Right handed beta helix domain-containing protein n=1 Tax=Flaviaesturariibacter amylovorans TaxID=1084520 RepID=A0ABP8GRI5_9BACT